METASPAHPAIDLSNRLYYQLVHTLTGLLPPPPDDAPETLLARTHAAIAKVASMLPVNANEADLAAQCIASRAQAEDLLRLVRQHAGNIGLVLRLNAQYGSMVRTSLSVHARLIRVQTLRQKREANNGAANQDAWTLHVAERSMLAVVDPDARLRQTASPEGAPNRSPEGAPNRSPEGAPNRSPEAAPNRSSEAAPHRSPEAAPTDLPEPARAMWPGQAPAYWPGAPHGQPPAPCADHTIGEYVSQSARESHDAAIETWLSEKFRNRRAKAASELDPREVLRQAVAKARSSRP